MTEDNKADAAKSPKIPVMIRLEIDILRQLRIRAAYEDRSLQAVMRRAFLAYLAKPVE